MDFESFPKIPRLSKDVVITEKIDGTNAGIYIDIHVGTEPKETANVLPVQVESDRWLMIKAASRKRFVHPGNDNFGFAKWVWENADDLKRLSVGIHHGEWWGQGIQRRYGLEEKRFSLFNTNLWSDERGRRPECCHVVPVLYQGPYVDGVVDDCLDALLANGSQAAKGFRDPEGVIMYHTAAKVMFKKTFDDEHKTEKE